MSGSDERVSRGPRWLRILGGLILVLIALLCVAGSAALFFLPSSEELATRIVGGVLCVVSLWLLVRGLRLLFDRPVQGGLMSPLALRIAAVLFFCLPWIGLWTGYYYQEHPVLAVLQALFSFVTSVALWRMARSRSLRAPGRASDPASSRQSTKEK